MHKTYRYLIFFMPAIVLAAPTPADPCASLFAMINRPTQSDSVCTVKPDKVMLEMGAQYQDLYPGEGHGNVLPQPQLRFGWAPATEFTVLPPNYIKQYGNATAAEGFTNITLGLKHQFNDNGKILFAAESLFALPTGDDNFGSDGLGVAINAMFNYAITDTFSLSGMFGVTTETTSTNSGGGRYNSFNPDLVLSWQFNDHWQYYIEAYAQTSTGPDQSAGYNTDTGFQYLATENIELDIEYGQRLGGQLNGFARYWGAGFAVRF